MASGTDGLHSYNEVGGLSWREGEHSVTLVVISRLRNLARGLAVPGAALLPRRGVSLRDKIGDHGYHFSGTGLHDLGVHDERDEDCRSLISVGAQVWAGSRRRRQRQGEGIYDAVLRILGTLARLCRSRPSPCRSSSRWYAPPPRLRRLCATSSRSDIRAGTRSSW